MKKTLAWLTLLCLVVAALPALAQGAGHEITEKTVDFYFFTPDDVVPRTLWFIDGEDVPYMALSDWPELAEIVMTPEEGEA